MFDGGADALALHAFDIADRHARGEEWIFAEVLKVSSVHRCAIDVYAWSQQKVDAFGARVTSNLGTHALGQRRIPRRRQRNAAGHGRGWSKVAYSDRAIGHLQSRYFEPRDVANKKALGASEQVDLFLECHLAEDRVDPALNLGRGLLGRGCG